MPALSAGVTAIAPLSRELWLEDAHAFRQIKGYAPLDIRIGYSGWGPRAPHNTAPAVYVHKNNPLQSLSMLDLMRLATAGSQEGDINTWAQLGLGNDWAARRIHLYGLRDDGGFATNQRMDKFAGQPWSFKYEALQSREAVIAAVANDPYGVGLTGWVNAGAISDKVRIMPLRATPQAKAALPDYNDVAAGNYPLSAYLHLYVDAVPGHKLEPFIIAYLEMALSAQGQAIIKAQKDSDEGYVPLSPEDLAAERAKLYALMSR
jgi:phosphate transport system substrate-binding protein